MDFKTLLFDKLKGKLALTSKTTEGNIELEVRIGTVNSEKDRVQSEVPLDIFSKINNKLKKMADPIEEITLDISQGDIRTTIKNVENIKKYCGTGIIDKTSTEVKSLKKVKIADVEEMLDYSLRIGLSQEIEIENGKINDSLDKLYRYKKRSSFKIGNFRYDLTVVKSGSGQTMTDSRVLIEMEKYEVECELITKEIDMSDIEVIYKLLVEKTGSPVLIPYSKGLSVFKEYEQLVGKGYRPPNVKALRKDILMKDMVDFAVTYKVDGLHHLLYVDSSGDIYLIDNNNNIKYTGFISVDAKYSIYDCELIYIKSTNEYQILLYDALFFKGKDIRGLPLLVIDTDIIPKKFNADSLLQEKIGEPVENKSRFNAIEQFIYSEPISEYPLQLVIKLKKYLYGKTSIYKRCEVLLGSELTGIETDGLILAKVTDVYPSDRKVNAFPNIFKYKPIDKLSIDLLVSLTDLKGTRGGQEYKSVSLKASDGKKLVEFIKTDLPITDNALRTEEHEIITNNSVVEFIYKADQEYKWVALRLRPDKTIKKAPNSILTAKETYSLIMNPITPEMIKGDVKVVLTEAEAVYRTGDVEEANKIKALANYHNRIKEDLLKTVLTGSKGKIYLIDFACGKGGDLLKWRNSGVTYVTGIDKFSDTISEARTRADALQKGTLEHVDFIQGDLTKPIEECAISNDSELLTKVISKYMGLYNIASCQFAIHYFFESKKTLDIFLTNVSKCLKMGGYFIGTTLNGQLVDDKFKKDKTDIINILADDGSSLYTIKKEYIKNTDIDIGYKIVPKIAGLTEMPEWLVNFSVFESIMKDYGFSAVDMKSAQYQETYKFGQSFEELSKWTGYKKYVSEMTKGEKEYSFLSSIFIFQKTGGITKHLNEKLEEVAVEPVKKKLQLKTKPKTQ